MAKKRAITVTPSPVVNGVLGYNTAILLTIEESIFDTDTETTSEVIASGPIIQFDQLSYLHNYKEDQSAGQLIIKNGDVTVLTLDDSCVDASDETEWDWEKRDGLWNTIFGINSN